MNRSKQMLLVGLLPSIAILVLFLTMPLIGLSEGVVQNLPSVELNELMADNENTLENPNDPGKFDDWIELYNDGTAPIDLQGFYLTDDFADLTKHQITQSLIISPDSYLVFFADGNPELGAAHLDFKLSANGEAAALVYTDGLTIIDGISFMTQTADVSFGQDANGDWGQLFVPTPGEANVLNSPVISSVIRSPALPTPADGIVITAAVSSGDGGPVTVRLNYQVNAGTPQVIDMTSVGGDFFTATIPPQAQDDVVKYYVTATNDSGFTVPNPSTAPATPYQVFIGYTVPTIRVNELMADNDSVLEDPDKADSFPDWIELLNFGESAVDISGMHLTDKLTVDEFTSYEIPTGTVISPGGTIIFFADSDPEEGPLHLPFSLGKGGDSVGLYDTVANGVMEIDTVTFGQQVEDRGYVRCGPSSWRIGPSSPGVANLCLDTFLPIGVRE